MILMSVSRGADCINNNASHCRCLWIGTTEAAHEFAIQEERVTGKPVFCVGAWHGLKEHRRHGSRRRLRPFLRRRRGVIDLLLRGGQIRHLGPAASMTGYGALRKLTLEVSCFRSCPEADLHAREEDGLSKDGIRLGPISALIRPRNPGSPLRRDAAASSHTVRYRLRIDCSSARKATGAAL